MPASLIKALVILSAALMMLILGSVYGEALTPWVSTLEQEVASAFWPTWWWFVGIFIVMALVALPVGALFSMGGGLLFGALWGGLAGWLSTSVAALISFWVMRWWLGEPERASEINGRINKLAQQLNGHSLELLMVLRIVPLVPFYLINVAGALSAMSARKYALGSLIGLVPSTFLYALIGHSFGSWVEVKARWDQGEVLSGPILGALVALGLLAGLSAWGARRVAELKTNHSKSRPKS